MKTKILLSAFTALSITLFFSQCKKKELTADDRSFFDKSIVTTGFTYYKNDSSYLPKSSASGHGRAYFRVRFNSTALAALTDNGKLPAGGSFPDGSLVVKEIYDTQGGNLQILAVMEKSTGNSLAGGGWVWGEYYADGSLGISVTRKGSDCTGCHSATGNRDYMRLFELFP